MPTITSPAPGALTTPFGQCVHTTEASGLTDEVRRYEVIRRTGDLTRFDASKIQVAMTKAFLAVEGNQAAASRRIHDIVEHLTAQVMEALFRRLPDGGAVHIEDIQDYVELPSCVMATTRWLGPMCYTGRNEGQREAGHASASSHQRPLCSP